MKLFLRLGLIKAAFFGGCGVNGLMTSFRYVLNIGTLATWLMVAGASILVAVVEVEERLPVLEENGRDEVELSVVPLAMGSAPARSGEDAADELASVDVAESVELPETPALPEIPDLAEWEPLPEIPRMPERREAPDRERAVAEDRPRVAAVAPRGNSSGRDAAAAGGVGSGRGEVRGRADGAGSSAVGSERWVGGRMPRPNYPAAARRSGQEGRVVVQFSVDERGDVVDAKITSSCPHSTLNEEALRTVRRWKFRPGPRASASRPIIFKLK